MDIFEDLRQETENLQAILRTLSASQWASPSAAVGWSVRDVVLHLAQSEEAVVLSLSRSTEMRDSAVRSGDLDEAMDAAVRADDSSAVQVFDRWLEARSAALSALLQADPEETFSWAATPLKPKTLATTRLAEHWAHTLDITSPLGIPNPDTARLWHISRLAHRTLPYAFALSGDDAPEVLCRLVGPGGEAWTFGPGDATNTITGSAGEFCRVGARRLDSKDSALVAAGPQAAAALRLVRNYAA